ncbi:hypothetical protein ICL16_26535 [Iningainema sp. BLCCT55]|uniref:histidine kinase n=1 Tax=Iningainema tapete BLCC-T55 TaxID=2748662 RepID=A0A8J6XF84_9CYAN|nr:hypothetical protein [Iningainema tapete]MBD2775520.1 hypothetical protein [Iningainema tapete BLCC-T55]
MLALLEDYGEQLDSLGQDYARYISDAALQMDTLISDLLGYSRLSRRDINLQPTDLTIVVQDALNQLGALQEGAEVLVESPLPHVIAHGTKLVQVVTNYINKRDKICRAWCSTKGAGVDSGATELDTPVGSR